MCSFLSRTGLSSRKILSNRPALSHTFLFDLLFSFRLFSFIILNRDCNFDSYSHVSNFFILTPHYIFCTVSRRNQRETS